MGSVDAIEIIFDKYAHLIYVCGYPVDFPRKEWEIMELFYEQRGRAIPREEIKTKIFNKRSAADNTVSVYVHRVNDKLRQHGCQHVIETVRGLGYRW